MKVKKAVTSSSENVEITTAKPSQEQDQNKELSKRQIKNLQKKITNKLLRYNKRSK